MENKEKIYVVTHKPFKLGAQLINKGYDLITVGNNKEALKNEGVFDSEGENISSKNPNYCELTAVYWIWKNTNSEIKGFCHYRRYFTAPTIRFNQDKVLTIDDFSRELNASKTPSIILPERKYYNKTSENLYLECGYKKDLDITRDVIQEKYPEYLNEYDSMLKNNTGYITNMMVAKKEIFDEYCSWLFDILFEVEKRTDISNYTTAEARIYGYISERLVDVWVSHNNIKCIEYQSINTENKSVLKYTLYRLSRKLKIYKAIKNVMFNINKKRFKMTADTKHRPFKKNIISVLMILMGILVVLSFNTIYTTSVGYAPFVVGLIFLSSILFLLDPVTLISYKSILLLAIYYLVAIILIFVSDFSNFSIFNFILDFPLCLLIVNYLIDKDLMVNFLRSLCNIIFIVACVSLIFWFLSSILKVISPTSSYLINWGGYKKVNSFYNMYFEAQGLSIDGILSNLGTFSNINRNCAIFVEAVMANFIFSIGFILNELIEKNMYKRVVFLIAVLSTFTTSGIVTFCFFTLYLVSNMKSDNRFAFF